MELSRVACVRVAQTVCPLKLCRRNALGVEWMALFTLLKYLELVNEIYYKNRRCAPWLMMIAYGIQ
jgi:hypothetical protein